MVLNREIDFSLIKNKEARFVLENILQKNPDKRWSLEQILESDWVTNKGNEKVNIDVLEEQAHKFGNINRLTKDRQKSYSHPFNFISKNLIKKKNE